MRDTMGDRAPVYPYPQWAHFSGGEFERELAIVTRWANEALAGPALTRFESRLCPGIAPAEDPLSASILIDLTIGPAARALLGSPGLGFALPAEGYWLQVSPERIVLLGADRTGCLYGLWTLAQLAETSGGWLRVPLCEVRDWPAKQMRGVHLYLPGKDNLGYFVDLLAWLASLRYNTLFLEIGGGMRFERHPEVNDAWVQFCQEVRSYPGGPRGLQGSQPYPKDSTHTELAHGTVLEKAEVGEIVRVAREYGIEIVPEVPALSHAYYMCCAHPEIAERQYDPWPDTYCPSNPASYELYFDLVDEVLETFRPRLLHIGHDEVYTLGACERCRGKSGAELLAGDITRIHDFVAERGVRTVMWGDKLQNIIVGGVDHGGRARRYVSPERHADHTMLETYQAVDFIPKDVLIMDWYWGLDPDSVRYFRRKGFEVVLGNFGGNFAPQEFNRWEKRAAGEGVVGAEVSSWSDVSEYAFGHNLTFFNLLFAANMLWWAGYKDAERGLVLRDVARLQATAREWLAGGQRRSESGGQWAPVSLGPGDQGADPALALVRGTWSCLGTATFVLGSGAVQADAAHPDSAEISVGRAARALAFLHYAKAGVEPMPTWGFVDPLLADPYNVVGQYVVRYADGSAEGVPVRYGDNVSDCSLAFGESVSSTPFWAVPAWEGRDPGRAPVTLWAYEWQNPHPEKIIASVTLQYGRGLEGERISLLALSVLA